MFKKINALFLIESGLPGRIQFKNVLIAPDALNGYSAEVYPLITDAVNENCTQSNVLPAVQTTVQYIDNVTMYLQDFIEKNM